MSVAVFNDEIRNLLKAGGFNEEGKGLLTNKATSKEQIFQNLWEAPKRSTPPMIQVTACFTLPLMMV
jgi:hypothetical protein